MIHRYYSAVRLLEDVRVGRTALAFSHRPVVWFTSGISEVSRFSCMEFPNVRGVYDYAGPTRTRAIAPCRAAFRFDDSVGVPIAVFRSSIPSPSVPLFTLHHAPRDALRKTRGRVDRYSLLVRLLHPLLHAGLSRRTVNYFYAVGQLVLLWRFVSTTICS